MSSIKALLSTIPLLACLVGCTNDPSIVPVKGRVEFKDGTPVKVGTLETKCRGLESYQSSAKINPDGTFSLTTLKKDDGAVVGEHECVVVQFIPLNESAKPRSGLQGVVHRKHSSYATSGLKFTVPREGITDLVLRIEGTGPKGENAKGHATHQEAPSQENSTEPGK